MFYRPRKELPRKDRQIQYKIDKNYVFEMSTHVPQNIIT